ncbi:MAG: amino acid racemase [Ruminococcaceae bacterium]|nr:amino acid racemase [Oscillospiraceae bacterium]
MHSPHLLGILGGLGPMASAYFYEMITAHTAAARDQDHIDIILSSRASTPDRTDFILGRSADSPLPAMIEDAQDLQRFGARAIVIPCNTAHYFIDQVRASVSVPVPSIIRETARFVRLCGCRKAGILATEGTVSAGAYQNALDAEGVAWQIPDAEGQSLVSRIIYDYVKRSIPCDPSLLYEAARPLREDGCDCMILGCTELSVAARGLRHDPLFVDSLEVLACRAILLCEKETKDFRPAFSRLAGLPLI